MPFTVTADSKNIRGVAEDNVGCNPQDDIWSALIMNIPAGGGIFWMNLSWNKDEADFTAVTTTKPQTHTKISQNCQISDVELIIVFES